MKIRLELHVKTLAATYLVKVYSLTLNIRSFTLPCTDFLKPTNIHTFPFTFLQILVECLYYLLFLEFVLFHALTLRALMSHMCDI